MMTKQKAIVIVGRNTTTLTEWARSSDCSSDTIETMSDPHIGLYKYVRGADADADAEAQKRTTSRANRPTRAPPACSLPQLVTMYPSFIPSVRQSSLPSYPARWLHWHVALAGTC